MKRGGGSEILIFLKDKLHYQQVTLGISKEVVEIIKMSAQDLQFELIKKATFDEFNGEKVVQDLMSNKDLWVGVIMDRLKGTLGDLVTLRDICTDSWRADTLYILSSSKDDDKLQKLAEGWQCDSITWWRKRELFNHIVCYTHAGILVLRWNQNNYYGA